MYLYGASSDCKMSYSMDISSSTSKLVGFKVAAAGSTGRNQTTPRATTGPTLAISATQFLASPSPSPILAPEACWRVRALSSPCDDILISDYRGPRPYWLCLETAMGLGPAIISP